MLSLTKGTHWKVTALAEIREQANAFVRHLLHQNTADSGSTLTTTLARSRLATGIVSPDSLSPGVGHQ